MNQLARLSLTLALFASAGIPAIASSDTCTARLTKAQVTDEDLAGKTGAVTRRPDGVSQIYFQDRDGDWIEINDAKE